LNTIKLKKILDKSIKAGIRSVTVFVGAHDILYIKIAKIANSGREGIRKSIWKLLN